MWVLHLSQFSICFFVVCVNTYLLSCCVCSSLIPTSQTEGTQAAVCQLDIGRRGQLFAQLHHHTQRGLATKQDHLQVPTEKDTLLLTHCFTSCNKLGFLCNQVEVIGLNAASVGKEKKLSYKLII